MSSHNRTNEDAMDVDDNAPSMSASLAEEPETAREPLGPPGSRVGFVYSPEMMMHYKRDDNHEHTDKHVENPERLSRIIELIRSKGLHLQMKALPIRPVQKHEALLVHSEDHWNKVLAIKDFSEQKYIDTADYYEALSLYVMEGTTQAAKISCGGVIESCLAVANGVVKKSVAIVRPPGHHAEPDEHMGFCFLNNVAVGARVVQQMTNLKRILILDWDIHHGNGTHRAFIDDPSVLYISLHLYRDGTFYPTGTLGGIHSCGEGAGLGRCVNIPWESDSKTDADYLYAFQKIVMPIAMEFAPELVIISAGFDAAEGDPLGDCNVTPAGYAHMTHMLCGLAGGRVVVALEGGYELGVTAKSFLAVLEVILGGAPPEMGPLTPSVEVSETIWLVAKEQSKYWNNINVASVEPRDTIQEITYSIPEILKSHRQHHLYTTYNMMQVPLIGEEMQARFDLQIMATPNLLDREVMIVLVHEFGNLRMELESSTTCDLHMERSYLIDFSKQLIPWIVKEGYSLLDINLFPKPYFPATQETRSGSGNSKSPADRSKDVMTYLWDNYIQISGAKKIVFIGHGPGCQPIIDLMQSRTQGLTKIVKGVVQVLGHSNIPLLPKYDDELISWFQKHSMIAVPSDHHVLLPSYSTKTLRRHGRLQSFNETRPIRLIKTALPAIQTFVTQVIGGRLNT